MAGKIPPLVMPSRGISVRNSQLITEMPLMMIKARITNRMATTRKLSSRKLLKAKASQNRLDLFELGLLVKLIT